MTDCDQLITDHERDARRIAGHFWRKGGMIHDLDELESEALLTLVEAARVYDPAKSPGSFNPARAKSAFGPFLAQRIKWRLIRLVEERTGGVWHNDLVRQGKAERVREIGLTISRVGNHQDEEIERSIPDPTPTIEQRLADTAGHESSLLKQWISGDAARRHFTTAERKILRLICIDEIPVDKAHIALGVSRRWVNVVWNKALPILRKALSRYQKRSTPPTLRKCPNCGVEYEYIPYPSRPVKKYCSFECACKGRTGKPTRRQKIISVCKWCTKKFVWLKAVYTRRTGKFCSMGCLQKHNKVHHPRQKLPGEEELRQLYVDQKLSTVKIARMFNVTDPSTVRNALIKYGIERRLFTTKTTKCIEDGCDNPPHKIWHPKHKVWYGTRCKQHRRKHYSALSRERGRKVNNIPPEKWRYEKKAEKATSDVSMTATSPEPVAPLTAVPARPAVFSLPAAAPADRMVLAAD